MSTFLYAFAGIVVGGVITWLTSRFYYKQATIDLRGATNALQKALGAIAYLLEHPGTKAEVQRDSNGNVTGIVIHAVGTSTLEISAHGTLTATNAAGVSSTLGPLSSASVVATTEKSTLRTSR